MNKDIIIIIINKDQKMHVYIVVLLTLSLIKSDKYSGAVLLTALCVKSKIFKIILS